VAIVRTVADIQAHCSWLIERGRQDEPAELFLPRLERQRRKANKEQHRRVVFECDPITYAAWHEMRERYWTLLPNKVIALDVMVQILNQVSDAAIVALGEEDKPF
jgi:hypothetical protein